MSQIRVLYSVIQYMPDSARAEAANVGVALFVPSLRWLEVRVSPTLARVRQFFQPSPIEMRRIELTLQALQYRMELARTEFESEDNLARFVAARANAMRLTAPRLAMAEDTEHDLANLYAKLVGDQERPAVGAGL